MASLPMPTDGVALTHFIVAADVERASRFYSDVLGGEIVLAGEPTIIALANSWIIINVGGGPTDDKPTVTLEPPSDPDRVSSFLNSRVADIDTLYRTWSERGAHFLTPPIDRGREIRCLWVPKIRFRLQPSRFGGGHSASSLVKASPIWYPRARETSNT